MPKVSVLMPVYNTKEEYLREAIESILNQTFTDFEFIILNDGSTDENVETVIKGYEDKRIKYFYKKNSGIADTLNLGLDKAKGLYVARMDSDDISLPNRFEKQVEFLDNNKDISLVGTWFNIFPKNEIIRHPVIVTFLSILQGCVIGHPTVMFRLADFNKYSLRYNALYRCEDYELWSRAICFLKMANVPEVLLNYRWDGQNISVKKSEEIKQDVQKVQQDMLEFLTLDDQVQTQIKNIINSEQKEGILLPHFWGNLIGLFLSHQKKKEFKRKFVKSKNKTKKMGKKYV